MAFEKIIPGALKRSGTSNSALTISAVGAVRIGSELYAAMGRPEFVVLSVDRENSCMGLLPCAGHDPEAFSVKLKVGKYPFFCSKAALYKLSGRGVKEKQYPFSAPDNTWTVEEDMYVVRLVPVVSKS